MAKHFHTKEHEIGLPYRFSVGPVFEKFYEGLKEEKIWGNQCPKCKKILVPARTFCPQCFVDMDEWMEVSQEGEIVTWTLSNKGVFGLAIGPPFVGALMRLDGTACNFFHLLGGFDITNQDLLRNKTKPGNKVKAVWNDEKKGHMLDIRYFEPL